MSTSSNIGEIRNIQQSVQNRDVIKQASDIIVYIDGQDYLINPYLGADGVTVRLNDYVNNWQSSYDIDGMVPSGSLTLSVPIHDDHLFRAPGGNNTLKSMADIRVFAKGYYLSPRGNTMYYQIFKGFISSIVYTPTGKMTTITLTCFGALGMLERMQVEQNPSTMSSAPMEVTPYTSTTWNLDPYQSIAWVFLYSSMIDGFEQYSIKQAAMNKTNPYYEAVDEQYVAKWQAILYDIARDVHVFGSPNVNDVISSIEDHVKPPDGTNTNYEKEALGSLGDKVGKKSEVQQTTDQQDFYAQLRRYMPDMGIGSIQLLNGRVTSRLERLRYMTNLVGFEAYQDVDGGIIIKPPLYNLDVVNLASGGDPTLIDDSLGDLSDGNNPFVVQLSEILPGESESEDEAGVRMTRITARGDYNQGFHWNASREMMATAEDIDVQKLSQFGLRTEPPKEAHWFTESNGEALYAFAASEMARANRGYRTYNITIPLRPEIKLGFPMYLPHKDIYGYIKSVSMSWTKGSQATTSITLDSLRRRPLLPETQTVTNAQGKPEKKQFMTKQPNLILQWTTEAQSPPPTTTTPSPAAIVGNLATLPFPQQLVVNQAVQMMEARKRKGNDYGVNSDSATNNWRIQLENGAQDLRFDYDRPLDPTYYHALRSRRPYTDAKGYEVVGPFPWGRWKSLKEALSVFTISDALGNTASGSATQVVAPVSPDSLVLSNADAFLFTGDSTAASTDSATNLVNSLINQAQFINNFKVFELEYTSTTATSSPTDSSTAQNGLGSTLTASVPPSTTPANPQQAASTRASTMLSGTSTSPSFLEQILDSVDTTTSAPPTGTPVQDQTPFLQQSV